MGHDRTPPASGRPFAPGRAAVLVLLAAAVTGQAARPADWVERRGISELIGIFTASRDAPARRRLIAKEIHSRRPARLAELVGMLGAEAAEKHQGYLAAFYDAGQAACAAKIRGDTAGKIRAWHETLTKRTVTTKALRAKAGPAMKNLRVAVTVTAAEILADPAVAEQRKKLLEQIELLEWCRKLQGSDIDKDGNVAPGESDGGSTEFAARLKRDERTLAIMSLVAPPADRKVLESNWKRREHLPSHEYDGIADVNVMRILMGVRAAAIDLKLCNAARGHSADMVRGGFFSHTSPVPGKASPWARAKKAGTSANGECIYKGSTSPQRANQAWFFSPGHHSIMFSAGARRLGMGRDKRTWTLMTGR